VLLVVVHARAEGPPPKNHEPSDRKLYPTPGDIELGPAVQFGGPYPFPVGVGGRIGMFARVHRYFSFGGDITYTEAVARRTLFGAPVGGAHFRIGVRACTHASFMHFCLAGGFAGMNVVGADNAARSAFPNDMHFLPMLGVGATWNLNDWIKVRPMLEGGAMVGVPVTMVDQRPDRIYEPFPLFATMAINLAFAIPTTLKPGENH